MIKVIVSPDVLQGQHNRLWRRSGAVFAASSAFSGATVGAGLGAVGGTLTGDALSLVAAVMALGGIVAGAATLFGQKVPLIQRDRETPRRWLSYPPSVGAALTGAMLGLGFTTRLGYALWYAVPVLALLTASPVVGAVLFATYGLARGLAAWGLASEVQRQGRLSAEFGEWVLSHFRRAQDWASFLLVALSAGVLVAT